MVSIPQKGNVVELSVLDVQVTPTTLTFGTEIDPVPVDKTVTHELILRNTQSSRVCVSVTPVNDAKDSLKYVLLVDHPVPFVIDGGTEQAVRIAVKVLCTTKLAIELILKTWHDNDLISKETRLKISIETETSTILDPDELIKSKEEEIGHGSFGIVYRGSYRGKDVAIKVMRNNGNMTKEDQKEFDREISMMEKYRHETIVEFIGAVRISGRQTIVTEFCEYGSLLDALKAHQEVFGELMKIKCLLDTSTAMNFLHSNGITHRDLKPENVLVVSLNIRDSIVAKLSDFGSARVAGHGKTLVTESVGTCDYMAPEILERSITYDNSVDVYSFSMLMYTVYTGVSPLKDDVFSHSNNPYKMIVSGKRPTTIPLSCPEDVVKLMKLCWNGIPSKRPKFDQIHAFFEDFFLECRFGGKEGVKARQMAKYLLNKMPQLDSDEVFVWSIGDGTEFVQLCELLKTNAIPTKRLEFKRMIVKTVDAKEYRM